MHNHIHTFSYDEKERRTRQHPEEILQAIGVASGNTFMDIGSNDGFFTIPAAKIVGETGKVYAVDTDADAIERLKGKAAKEGLQNIVAQTNTAEDTIFYEGCADVIFFGTVLHDFSDPLKVLQNAKAMLKPTGKVINLDWKKKETEMGPPVDIRFSEEDANGLMEKAGLRVIKTKSLSQDYYLMTATK